MIYHVFPNKLHHTPAMINLLVRHTHEIGISENEQAFYLYGTTRTPRNGYEHLDLPADRLTFKKGRGFSIFLLAKLKEDDLLILHSGFSEGMWRRLLFRPRLWKKTALIIWGAEVQRYHRQKKLLKGNVLNQTTALFRYHNQKPPLWKRIIRTPLRTLRILRAIFSLLTDPPIRNLIIPRLGAVCIGTPEEFRIVNKCHGPCKNYFPMIFNTNTSELKPSYRTNPSPTLRVLLGHSGYSTNGHLETLHWLKAYKDEDMQVICPLAYPARSSYTIEVVETGKQLLGDRFIPLLDLMPRPEYNEFLQSIDILILNAKKQQAAYHIHSLALLGKKIYLSTLSPFYGMLSGWGIKVFDVCDIETSSFQEFSSFSRDDATRNHEMGRQHFSLQATVTRWEALIATLKNGTGVAGR